MDGIMLDLSEIQSRYDSIYRNQYYNEIYPDYINAIILNFHNGVFDKRQILSELRKYNIESFDEIKEELLDILILYVNLLLLDNCITNEEENSFSFLKKALTIQEGDFYELRYEEIQEIIQKQLVHIYMDDFSVDSEEEVLLSGLQGLFDLGYDQFYAFIEPFIDIALIKGSNVLTLNAIRIPKNTLQEIGGRDIPQKVKDSVWRRDGGKCVKCGTTVNLEFDHIIPVSLGGSNTYRNIQLLCQTCNRKKSNIIGFNFDD